MSLPISSGTEDAASDGGRVEVTVPQASVMALFSSVLHCLVTLVTV